MRAIVLSALLLLPASAAFSYECPLKGSQEQAEDCPWAGLARELGGARPADFERILSTQAPAFLRQLEADRANPALLKLWGESMNYDELAKGEIVDPALLAFLSRKLGARAPRGKVMHAGVEHTYGYLFSLLPTKFGFKRARWVRPDVENGLGLPRGCLGPNPPEGTLLSNVTCLAGGLVLKDDPAAAASLKRACAAAPAGIVNYAAGEVKRTRLAEDVRLKGGRTVSLRTDLVPFSSVQGGNTHLLIYSVHDSALKRAYLVTAFPVALSFVESVTAADGLGRDKPVQTRYNAFVDGLTGEAGVKGTRSLP